MKNWRNKKTKQLFEAFLELKTTEEVGNFCRDLMTLAELEELASRWEVAQKLYEGESQRKVSAETGVSIATVTRVNKWLRKGSNGYNFVLQKQHHHPHRG